MKNIGKKFLASILAIAQVITFTPVNNITAYAADSGGSGNEEARDGNRNSLFKSTLDSDGNLTVTITEKTGSTDITKNVATALWGGVKDKIKTVTFDDAITNIEGMNDCVNLTSIKFPSSLTATSHTSGSNDGQNAFNNCTSLTSVDMSNITNLEHMPYGYFDGCTTLTSVKLPEGIECISSNCFKSCTSLTTINIPNSCKTIYADAFKNDTSLKSIDLNKVERIDAGAFNNTGLTEIYFPATVQSVGNAFNECYSLQKISGGNGLANYLGTNNGGIKTGADRNNNAVVSAFDIFAVNNMQAPNNSFYDGVYNVNHYHKSLETNVDDAANCIKNANWYKAGRYLYTLNFIDATHQVFDTDKTFTEYTAYFDNYTKEMAAVETSTTGSDRVAVKPLQAKENATEITTANLQVGIRSLDYKPQTKDEKIYTPSDKWKVSTDENGEVVDITENTTIDTIIQKAGMNNHVINLYLTKWDEKNVPKKQYTVNFYNIKGKDTVTQTYNENDNLKDIPKDLDYSDNSTIYTFKGWSTSRQESDITTVDESIKVTQNLNYYAIYEKKSKVVLKYVYTTMSDSNNPACGDAWNLSTDTTKYLKDTRSFDSYIGAKLGDTYEKAPETLKNLSFYNWYVYDNNSRSYKEIEINADTEITWDNVVNGDERCLVLYAIYGPKKYNVSFVNEDNTSENKSGQVEAGKTYGDTFPYDPFGGSDNAISSDWTPSSDDKVFKGWKVNDTAEIVSTENALKRVINEDTTFKAVFEAPKYTAKFYYITDGDDYNDTPIIKSNIDTGTSLEKVKPDSIPERKSDSNYTYTFKGWSDSRYDDYTLDESVVTIDNDVEFFAKYDKKEIKKYIVTFKPENGEEDTVKGNITSGTHMNTLTPANPTKEGYTFKGWSKDRTTVIDDDVITSDTTYFAVYEKDPVVTPTIKIIFVDDDETTVLLNENVYALGISFKDLTKPADPTKASDEDYTYQFKGWRVKGETDLVDTNRTFNTDTTLVAVYEKTPVIKMVKVNFIDEDSTPLCDEKTVVKNSTLGEVTDKPLPTKAEDDNFTYVFDGWTVDDNKVDDTYVISKDTTFKATYKAIQKPTEPTPVDPEAKVTVIFEDYDLTEISRNTDVVSGSALSTVKPADPSRAEDEDYTYTFAGWKLEENNAVVDDDYKILKDTTFIATYTATKKDKTYHVIFKDEDGTILDEKDVPANTPLGDIKPKDPSKDGKDFNGWDDGTGIKPDDTPIVKDTTFTAKYEPKVTEKVTVKFVDYDDKELDKKEVEKNVTLGSLNEDKPKRDGFNFIGWSKEDIVVDDGYVITEDTVFIATYVTKEIKLIQIDGTLLDKDGKPIANAVVTLHSTVRQTKTDENGYYIFKNVELEEHEINAKVENTEVYKYNIDATDVENIKKVLEAQDKNYDVDSNISEKNGIVTITLNAKEKGNETPAPAPVEPTPVEPEPTPVEPTPVEPEPTPVEPTPVEPTPVEPTPDVPEVPDDDTPDVPDKPINVDIKVIPSTPTPKEDEETPKKHQKEEENIPKTGDDVFVYVIGLVAGMLVLKRKKRK